MKKIIIFSFLLIMMLTGCTNETNSNFEEGLNLAKEYKEALYNIDVENIEEYPFYINRDNPGSLKNVENEAKKYLIDDAIHKFMANRVGETIIYTAKETNRNIRLDDINFEFYSHNDKSDYDVFNYTADISFESPDGKVKDIIEHKGQIAIVKEDGEWKVANDHNGHLGPKIIKELK